VQWHGDNVHAWEVSDPSRECSGEGPGSSAGRFLAPDPGDVIHRWAPKPIVNNRTAPPETASLWRDRNLDFTRGARLLS